MPLVVGMRARATHWTLGSLSTRRGRLVRDVVSTGVERAGRAEREVGVLKPGVLSGVNEGLMRDGGGSLSSESEGDCSCVRS